jgi:arabinofuranosyltransferase
MLSLNSIGLNPSLRYKLDRFDGVLLLYLGILLSVYTWIFVNFSAIPYEDAAILMRYAKHLAQGHGIVWNVGEQPVDGATDFLFMVVVAILSKTGISIETSTRLISLISHVLTVVVIYAAIRKLHGASRWMAFLSGAYFAIGPGLKYVEAYFGTPFFALAACVTWCFAVQCSRGRSRSASMAFALSCLVMSLIRPEGVLLAGFMLGSIVYIRGLKGSGQTLAYFVGVFCVLGSLYFFWRWAYFGSPLPNPYYIKGRGLLHFAGLQAGLWNEIRLCLPLAPVFALGLCSSANTRRETTSCLIPLVGFGAIWILLSSETDFLMRFQYPILALALVSWPPLLGGAWEYWKLPGVNSLENSRRMKALLLVIAASLGALSYQYVRYRNEKPYGDGAYDVGLMLREYKDKNYTLATTEAGLLPFYSEWRTVDTWGLNDPWIAHRGQIDESYLDRYKPHVMECHALSSENSRLPPFDRWPSMVASLRDYATKRGYRLAAVFGVSPDDLFYYYVRPDFADSTEITERIRNTDYSCGEHGSCFNFVSVKK